MKKTCEKKVKGWKELKKGWVDPMATPILWAP
jgi:hypothetical protein